MTSAEASPAEEQPPEQERERERIVVGVRFREAARIYHYSAAPQQLFPGDYVVVETARGEELARVVTVPDGEDAPPRSAPRSVRPIIRQATRSDRDRAAEGQRRSSEMLEQMRQISTRDGLGLYPIAVQLNLAGSEGTGYFQAPEHVDFRTVVRELEQQHGVRLHMQLAGPRDRAKLVDGYDICGLRLCCASWMTNFPKVGIRTAKDQDLSLNPDSISGVCGRLLCCLTFEHEVYREMRGTLPKLGKRVSTPAGMGRVVKRNVLQQYITLALDDHPQRVDVPADEIGLAVRTEEQPNQALIEAERERERSEQLRRAAAPAEPAAEPDAAAPETADQPAGEPAAPERRRRRRRKRRVVNRDSEPRPPSEQPPREESAAAAPPPRRRRPRRRQRRAGPTQPPTDQSPGGE